MSKCDSGEILFGYFGLTQLQSKAQNIIDFLEFLVRFAGLFSQVARPNQGWNQVLVNRSIKRSLVVHILY